MTKLVFQQLELNRQRHTDSFESVGARSGKELDLDPVLNIDLFEMSEPTFPPHPHAGFSAVTYLLPESPGSFQNRDSLGDKSIIAPGDIHWTQAAFGMLHEEIPTQRGVVCRGFQLFINLRSDRKSMKPAAFHAAAAQLPKLVTESGQLTLLAGEYGGHVSPLGPLATEVSLFDGTLNPGSELALELSPHSQWFLFGITGTAWCTEGPSLRARQITTFSAGTRKLSLASKAEPFRFLLVGGKPIKEPVFWGGPFAMTSPEDLEKARLRFLNGEMGKLTSSF